MKTIDINFTPEQSAYINKFDFNKINSADSKTVIQSQNQVFRALTGMDIDFSQAKYHEAMRLIQSVKDDDMDRTPVTRENYMDKLKDISVKFIAQEQCAGYKELAGVQNDELVNFNYKGIDPEPVRKPEKPNIFKRLLNSVFGAFGQECDSYNYQQSRYDRYQKTVEERQEFRNESKSIIAEADVKERDERIQSKIMSEDEFSEENEWRDELRKQSDSLLHNLKPLSEKIGNTKSENTSNPVEKSNFTDDELDDLLAGLEEKESGATLSEKVSFDELNSEEFGEKTPLIAQKSEKQLEKSMGEKLM